MGSLLVKVSGSGALDLYFSVSSLVTLPVDCDTGTCSMMLRKSLSMDFFFYYVCMCVCAISPENKK